MRPATSDKMASCSPQGHTAMQDAQPLTAALEQIEKQLCRNLELAGDALAALLPPEPCNPSCVPEKPSGDISSRACRLSMLALELEVKLGCIRDSLGNANN